MRVVRWLLAHQVTMVGWKRCHNDQGNASSSSLLTTGLRPTLPPSAVSAAAVYAKPCSTQEAFQVQPRLIGIGSCGANSEPWSVYSEKLSGIPSRDSSCAGGAGEYDAVARASEPKHHASLQGGGLERRPRWRCRDVQDPYLRHRLPVVDAVDAGGGGGLPDADLEQVPHALARDGQLPRALRVGRQPMLGVKVVQRLIHLLLQRHSAEQVGHPHVNRLLRVAVERVDRLGGGGGGDDER